MNILKTLMKKLKVEDGGSNKGRGSVKRSREKGLMDHFFTPNAEAVVKNRSGKMTQTTMNDAYKKEARERSCSLISRCVGKKTQFPIFQIYERSMNK